ncbi:MAG: molybdopterin-dependent oxidoreductase, partial [Actinomycetota bacterium]|nr:molybdopterin-dependent oxidoreductase [Actinomycetota bacterium]
VDGSEPATAPVPVAEPVGRRAVVAAAAGVALAVPAVALLRRLNEEATFSYDGTVYSGPDIQPIAPNDLFYTVTKNVVDPNVAESVWRFEVGGLVAEPRTYAFGDLAALPAIDQESTLMCISNRIGAGLFSNAVWRGVPLRDLLEAAGPSAAAVEVLLHAADGFTDTFSIEKAMDPTTLVVYEMNGEPLPQRHGFPARIVVPGLYGEKNVKWLTGIEVVDYDAKGFYEQQGWGPNFEIPTRSDFFAPRVEEVRGEFRFRDPFRLGQAARLRGRAFAGARGVARVEFSADDGETWSDARIDYPGTELTWKFWSVEWRPQQVGDTILLSRATDGTGAVQPPDRRGIVPQGATGYHRVVAAVEG